MSQSIQKENQVVPSEVGDLKSGHEGKLRIEICDASERESVMNQWKQLENKIGNAPLMCSYDWTNTWLDHYGDVVGHRFLMAKNGRETVGICLLTEGVGRKTGPIPVHSLHLGTAGEADFDSACVEYNDLLVIPEFRGSFINEIMEIIFDDHDWDEFCIDGYSGECVQEFLACSDHFELRETPSYFYDFAKAGEDELLSQFGYSTRKTLRKNLRQYGEIKTEWAQTISQAEEIYEDLIRLHQIRWNESGEAGSYASERFTEFHRALIHKWVENGKMGLLRVSDEEGIIGCVQLFVDRNRALVYQGGQVMETGKRSPGVATDYHCMEECRNRGLDAYDFLGGESQHKQKLTTDAGTIVWAKLKRPRLKYLVTDIARQVRKWIPIQV